MDMSLQMHPIGPVPEETERVARSSFPKSNIYLRIRDELGAIYDDETFASLYPSRG
jgi:transposase